MKITRRTTVFVKTERKFLVARSISKELIRCEQCGEQMIPAQSSADFFQVSSRRIYRLIESEKIHFAETAANEIYVCLISVNEILNRAE